MTEKTANNSNPIPASTPEQQSKNTLMGILAYIGPLVIVSYITAKDDPFVKFHIQQGLVLLTIEIVFSIISKMIWPLFIISALINLGTFILSIVGIVNVAQGKKENLPVVGVWAKYFSI